MVVAPSADVALAVEGALFGGYGTAGQRCTSLGTVLVHSSVHDAFVSALDSALCSAAIGDPFDDVLYGPMLSQRFADRYESYLDWITPAHRVRARRCTGLAAVSADAARCWTRGTSSTVG